MANNRKIQGEIDKLLKKVTDQFEVYEDVYEKFENAPNQVHKERFENDLKKEIKKLQRLREQIKVLVASSEVKDKRILEETRRDIEIKMEDFKVCERETKTKAYSKEGLASNRNDIDTPLARTESWIKQSIQEIGEQIETAEFDLKAEGAFGGGRKKRSKSKSVTDDDPRVVRLDRLKTYSFRLEQLLRMLVNEDMDPEEVDEIEDDIKTFVTDNGNDDYDEVMDLFDVFCLPDATAEEEEEAERIQAEVAAKAAVERAAMEEKKKALAAAPSLPTINTATTTTTAAAPGTPVTTPTVTPTAVPVPKSQQVVAPKKVEEPTSPLKPTLKKPETPNTPMSPASIPSPTTGPKLTAAEVARGATKSMAATISAANSPTTGPTTNSMGNPTVSNLSMSSVPGGNTSSSNPPEASLPPPQQPTSTAAQPASQAALMGALESEEGGAIDDMDAMNDDTFGDDMPVSGGSLADIAAMTASMPVSGDWGRGPPGMASKSSPEPTLDGPSEPAAPTTPATNHKSALAALQELQNAIRQREAEQARAASLLDVSFRNLPIRDDVERGKPLPPRSGLTDLFPSVPLKSLNTYQAVQKLDESTLFFLFYYQQGTYQQYLAAKFLKSRGFRYHKKFHTWFQRHKKPIETSATDETGSYIYFDFETGWFSRVKERFVFKYTYLEGDV